MKKVFGLLLATAISLMLCSCSQQDSSADTSSDEASSSAISELTTTPTTKVTESVESVESVDSTDSLLYTEEINEINGRDSYELMEFNMNDIEFKTRTVECTGMEYLSEEQQRTFWNACFIYLVCEIDNADFFYCNTANDSFYGIPDGMWLHTGYSYSSVITGFLSVVSPDILFNDFMKNISHMNYNGEMLFINGCKGASYPESFEIIPGEITDDKVTFTLRCKIYRYPEADMSEDENDLYYDCNFEMTKTDGNWIMTRFDKWF